MILMCYHIQRNIRAAAPEQLIFLPQVRGDYIGIAIDLPESECQFDTDLSAGADNQYLFFGHVRGFGLQT